mmetsp:Transcript_13495/g.21472  ORF Transcript_13495/g.21472 Transcript_13495/m.21472 type:complete len:88 (+) Transcript_13495:118-381(+)
MADEAKQHSRKHQKWMLELLKEKGDTTNYEDIVKVGEDHGCDTVAAMLKVLKSKKVLDYKGQFLMYPMHKAEIISILNRDYDPETAD